MIRRAGALLALAAAALVAGASPAAAHGGQGSERVAATNYRTTITAITPAVEGIDVRVLEVGSRIELRNRTAEDVVVLGYRDEPFLRVGPDGVFENVRSPSTYANADRQGRTEIPKSADPDAEPEWRKVSDGSTARWHDHRAHWMGNEDPPAVAADRSRSQVVIPGWVIPMDLDGRRIEVTGDLTWVPGPSPWPWLAGAAGLACLTFAAARRWAVPTLITAAALLLAASGVEAAGVWSQSVQSPIAKAVELAIPGLAWAVLLVGVVWLWRRPGDAVYLIGGAGAALAWLFGVADLSWLSGSQLPSATTPTLARIAIMTSLGCGAALFTHALLAGRASGAAASGPRRAQPEAPPAQHVPGIDESQIRRHRWALLAGIVAIASLALLLTADSRDETPIAPRTTTQNETAP